MSFNRDNKICSGVKATYEDSSVKKGEQIADEIGTEEEALIIIVSGGEEGHAKFRPCKRGGADNDTSLSPAKREGSKRSEIF